MSTFSDLLCVWRSFDARDRATALITGNGVIGVLCLALLLWIGTPA